MTSENLLIYKIKYKQDRGAADSLITAYYDEMYVYAYRQLGDKHLAMDITQEIFISALQSLQSYDDHKSTFRTWIYRIATYKIIDYRRKNKITMVSVEGVELEGKVDFTEVFENQILLENIQRYVAEMKKELQHIFFLRIYGQYSFPEISNIMSMPEAAVKTKFYRMIKKLRKEFSE